MPERASNDFDMPSYADMMENSDGLYHNLDDDESGIHYQNLCALCGIWGYDYLCQIGGLLSFSFQEFLGSKVFGVLISGASEVHSKGFQC